MEGIDLQLRLVFQVLFLFSYDITILVRKNLHIQPELIKSASLIESKSNNLRVYNIFREHIECLEGI